MSPSMPRIALIAALDEAGAIGRANTLPWHLPADLAHFRSLTLDKPILMGRRTWESLPGLLPCRRHLIISRDPSYRVPGAEVFGSIAEAIAATAAPELMVIGGAMIYAQTLPLAQALYLTLVHTRVEGDVYFPPWDPAQWREVRRSEHPADAYNRYAMTFVELVRIDAGQPHPPL
ncbi:dihydrofolate reductase [Caldichromatium japonicum]|uniref:Dihydrofolate reductase n=1 Tax=Caldichromatium japonicum TaxID=2699430 RepID=A0A6G7VDQ6_9GAMM|nr:dihydrofolate reductase [Caldichromatium japonicum]QIK38006.1 dihydrofolate reductase [Caldichromatium japonicum]